MGSKTRSQLNQWLAAAGVYLVNISTGMSMGWSSSGYIKITNGEGPFVASKDEASWIVSVSDLGIIVGAVLSAFLISTVGRRGCLMASPVACLIGNGLMFLGSSVVELCIGRIFLGMGYGIDLTCCSVFLGEISTANMRGKLCAMITAMVFVGILIEFCVGPYVSYGVQVMIGVVPPIICLALFILWIPETPYYLATKGRTEEMFRSLAKLRGTSDASCPEVTGEGLKIKKGMEEEEKENKLPLKEFFSSPGNRKASGIVFFLCGTAPMLGVTPLMSYAETMFGTTGSLVSPAASAIILSTVSLLVGLVSAGVIDRVGRRPLILYTAAVDVAAMGTCGVYFLLKEYYHYDVSSVSWLPLVSVVTFMISTNLGTTIVPFVLIGELLPTQSKTFIPCLTVTAFACSNFITEKMFPIVGDACGMYTVFWYFATWACVVGVFTYFLVPETRGKTLFEVQEMLHKSKKPDLTHVVHSERTVNTVSGVEGSLTSLA